MQEVSYGKILQTRFYKFYTSFAKNKIPHLVALYKASTLPSLILGCEAWTMTKKRIKKPEWYSVINPTKILKVPISTATAAIYAEIRELSIELLIDKRKLMYRWKLLASKTQINEIAKIKIHKQRNKSSIMKNNIELLQKYNIHQCRN